MMERPVEEEDAVEEEAPDWRMLLKYTKSLGAQSVGGNQEPFIPRRGEKDFEPTEALAPTQTKALQESRQALFTALSAGIRGHSSRDHVRCVWTSPRRDHGRSEDEPVIQPYVDGTAKGVLFSSIGRWSRERKRLELSPEELLYLVERGTVECWTAEDRATGQGAIPMSVQRAWAEIIGTNQLSLERYQVYAYLKRLGYIVLRKEHVDSIWRSQTRQAALPSTYSPRSFLANLFSFICRPILKLQSWLKLLWMPNSQPWIGRKYISTLAVANRSLIHDGIWKTYESVFNALSLTPSGPKVRLPSAISASTTCPTKNNGGYEVFYYVYKPNNRFPKSSPPTPDFQICVIDSEKMCIPNIATTNALLDTVQGPSAPKYPPTIAKPAADPKPPISRPSSSPPLHKTIISLLSFGFFFGAQSKTGKKPFRQNVFAKLKRGERNVLLAVNDHGIISFLKFTETHFAGTPLVGAQSSI
ncbi:uncharacterized protein PGTG_07897 [Puccinia graminis f. sp. tritici CRL 75-36-700-3]|uniref:tRNA-splicing endonuclease subunit Sen54 N-terminal domain-containing protein n=1 Tax=Puccinia graminis f. sp. tritici (strain CRL 75-36-700-3 / race SCCL) TaxID=418459 RepID=E3KBD5_PUCGT|nr:uncharacterized protein PGTG_07897 [Puccinia graminis f. sp. tritici CRL 75-36-700-3]EFP81648.2 hypothetical protein PGTG_07897 [Puccinia graminis f. sp. tritici CRL 75-36-700-3]